MKDSPFRNKTVVITGASAGLGKCLTLAFAREGARLVLTGRNLSRLEEVAAHCPGARVVQADITKAEDCERLIAETMKAFGSLDCLVLNAGISMSARFEDVTDLSLFSRIMDVNYLGPISCTHYALPALKASRGRIVLVSSIQGEVGVPKHTGYGASKHALNGFFQALRLETADDGITITTALPYWLKGTDLRANALGPDGKPLGAGGEPRKDAVPIEECAELIVKAAAKGRRKVYIPGKLRLLSLLDLLFPKIADGLIKGKAGKRST